MKRTGLVLGAELYYSRHPARWREEPRGQRAVVLAVVPWERVPAASYSRLREPYREAQRGGGVLVELDQPHGGPRRTVVPLSSLVGPWQETAAEYDRIAAVRDAERERRLAHVLREEDLRAYGIRQAVQLLGTLPTDYGDSRGVPVAPHLFAAMTSALAQTGWRYDPNEVFPDFTPTTKES